MFISAFLPLFLHRMEDEVHTPRERLRRSLGGYRLTAGRRVYDVIRTDHSI